MSCEADVKFRSVKQTPQSNAHPATNSERMGALDRKRPSPQPSIDDGKGKRRRLDVAQTEVRMFFWFECYVLMWEWKMWKTEDSEDGVMPWRDSILFSQIYYFCFFSGWARTRKIIHIVKGQGENATLHKVISYFIGMNSLT